VSGWRLAIRHGPQVEHQAFDDLGAAIAELERRAEEIRNEGPLEEISALRPYEPSRRVHARLELSSGRLFRGPEAGVDVMGNGALVPYVGLIRKRELMPQGDQSPFDAVREALQR